MIENSNRNLACKIAKHNQKRNKVVIERIDTEKEGWEDVLINELRERRIVKDAKLTRGDILRCDAIERGCALITTKTNSMTDKMYLCRPESQRTMLTIKRRFNVIMMSESKNEKEWYRLKEQEQQWKENLRRGKNR